MIVNNGNNDRVTVGHHPIVTADRNMMELLQLSETVAKSKAAILIQGEKGSGKQTFAKWIHQKSQRMHKPLEVFNCADVTQANRETNFISQLEKAHGGSFLLLEVSKLPSSLQGKLFQVLQEGVFSKGNQSGLSQSSLVPIDVRIIATSTTPLAQAVKSGEFREDLFYRLNVVNLKIPALTDRFGDVELLAKSFAQKWGQVHGKGPLNLSAEAVQLLNGHRWPLNIRELESTIERAVIFTTSGEIRAKDIQIQNGLDSAPQSLSQTVATQWKPGRTLNDIERNVIIDALKYHSGNRTHTAKALGISIRTLRNKLAEYRVLGIHL